MPKCKEPGFLLVLFVFGADWLFFLCSCEARLAMQQLQPKALFSAARNVPQPRLCIPFPWRTADLQCSWPSLVAEQQH